MKKLITICLVATIILAISFVEQVQGSINYDPEAIAPPPVLDQGWNYDSVYGTFVNSTDSPYVYNLAKPAYLRVTDDFVVGDNYYVRDFGSLILTTIIPYAGVPTGFPDPGESAWRNPAYSGGEVLLAAGAHNLTIQCDQGAGYEGAGFYTQLTTVPEPATICLLGLGGLALLRKRRA